MFSRLRNPPRMSSLFGLAVLIAGAGPAIARQEPETAMVPDEPAIADAMVELPDGRRLNLKCSGAGRPTVILDGGLGLDSSVWARVQPGLAATTRTCAYDRAGYGRSDPGPLPRDATRRTDDLLGLLDATAETAPFVLVGIPPPISRHASPPRAARTS